MGDAKRPKSYPHAKLAVSPDRAMHGCVRHPELASYKANTYPLAAQPDRLLTIKNLSRAS